MPGGQRATNGHPEVWAFLTVITFPIVLIASDILGAESLWSFLFAILATLAVLFLEAIVRGKLWPFEAGFVEHIGHPQTPIRILIFLGAVLLVLETALILAVATDRRTDIAILGLVLRKQCAAQFDPVSRVICHALQEPRDFEGRKVTAHVDPIGLAMREHAARAWFPNESLVTCAHRKIAQTVLDRGRCQHASLVHCSAWRLDERGVLRAKSSVTRYVGAFLAKDENGFYRAREWSDDYNSPRWSAALGDIAEKTRDTAQSLAILPDLITLLQAESLGRAQDTLRK